MAKKSKQWVGIRQRGHTWRACVRVAPGPGGLKTTTFPLATVLETMQAWRRDQQRKFGVIAPDAGTFAADLQDYLDRYRHRRSYRNVRHDLTAWVTALGGARSRHTIKAAELVRQIDDWHAAGVGAPTIRSRVASLRACFNKLDAGLEYVNPARALPNLPPPAKVEARGRDYATVARLLASMPEHRTDGRPSLNKRRAYVIAYCGLPPGMLMEVTRADLDWGRGTVRVGRRKKGGGVEPRTLRLSAEALAAFRAFDAANAYGPFTQNGLNACVKRAAVRIGLAWGALRLYDLRHSFLSQLYRVKGDQATVARFACHVPGSRATFRYTQAAHDAVDQAAIAAFSQSLAVGSENAPAEKLPAIPAEKLPAKVTRRRKVVQMQRLTQAS